MLQSTATDEDLMTTGSMVEVSLIASKFPGIGPLSWMQASKLQNLYGKNILSISKPRPAYNILFHAIVQPFNVILVVLAVTSAATGDLITMTIMVIMIVISSALKFFQEFKSSVAADALRNLVENYVTVIRLYAVPDDRDPNHKDVALLDANYAVEQEIYMEDIVPGDIVKLRAGCLIPGDLRILNAKDLFVSESALTGEAIPIDKYPLTDDEINNTILTHDVRHSPHLAFMGSSVVSGTAAGLVLKIGSKTMFGELATKLAKEAPKNAFQKGIQLVSFLFLGLMVVMLPIVTILSGLIQKDWTQALLFSIGVAVGLTPEMLPMIVNACLSKGAISMSNKKVIVKKLDSIINLGSMDILCTDKTGTLTQNKVVLIKHLDLDGCASNLPLEMAFLNSFFQTGLRNLIDEAVSDYFQNLQNKSTNSKEYEKVDEVPWDYQRRRMSVILKHKSSHLLVSKGALEEMLNICVSVYQNGTIVPLSENLKIKAIALSDELNGDGLRVVAVGYKILHSLPSVFGVKDEQDLVLAGLIGFLDPPKETTAPAIHQLMEYGITIKVLTGDTPVVCRKVCQQIGLPITGIVTTKDLINKTDEEISIIARESTIFAKLTPIQKAQVVKALKSMGHVVGFLGDGINDAAALKESDVGISVDDAVDVARESADIILLEKSLLVLVDGVIEGRKTYGNTIKYIKMAISSNFGNVFSILIASAWLPFLPMKTIHLVFQNLLYDTSQTVIPFDNMDNDYLRKPRKWEVKTIIQFMVFIGPLSSVFDILTFTFCWFMYGCSSDPDGCASEFQTSWFLLGISTQCFVIHMIRTDKIPFVQSTAALPLIIGSMCAISVAVVVATTSVSQLFEMKTPRVSFYPFLIGCVVSYCILAQVAKVIYIKVFKSWI